MTKKNDSHKPEEQKAEDAQEVLREEVNQEEEGQEEQNIHNTCEEEIQNLKNLYLRALADYKNLENRTQQVRAQMQLDIKKRCIEAFIEVADHIEQASVFVKDPGLAMVAKSFTQAFERQGVQELEVQGKEYDPHTAEVIEVVAGGEDDIVVEVLQKGYAIDGAVIRPARVKVSKKQ